MDFEMFERVCTIAAAMEEAMAMTDSPQELMMVLGTCIDQWTADKHKTYDEVHEWLEHLVEAHEGVNKALGPMVATSEQGLPA